MMDAVRILVAWFVQHESPDSVPPPGNWTSWKPCSLSQDSSTL
jgi:hypothetical protein